MTLTTVRLTALLAALGLAVVTPRPLEAQTISIVSGSEGPVTTVGEGDGELLIAIRFEDPMSQLVAPATLQIAYGAGSAEAGQDYQSIFRLRDVVPGVSASLSTGIKTLTFEPELAGSSFDLVVVVPLRQDQIAEIDEQVVFSFELTGGATLTGPRTSSYTLVDDDGDPSLPVIRFDLADKPVAYLRRSYEQRPFPVELTLVLDRAGGPLTDLHVVVRNLADGGSSSHLFEVPEDPSKDPVNTSNVAVHFPGSNASGTVGVLMEIEPAAHYRLGSPSRAMVLFFPEEESCAVGALGWLTCLYLSSLGQSCAPDLPNVAGDGFSSLLAAGARADGLLGTLTRLRDEVMATTPAGRYYTALFEDLSPAIIESLLERADLTLFLLDLKEYWLLALNAFFDGQGDRFLLTQVVVDQLQLVLDQLEKSDDPSLRAIVRRERQRLDLDGFVGLTMDQAWERLNQRVAPESCETELGALCLNNGRFRAEVEWTDFQGKSGPGHAVYLSDQSGTFWFFNEDNVELVVKVLDGSTINDHFWVFYGALSNVEYTLTVTDTQLGTVRSYRNPSGDFASRADIAAFPLERRRRSTLSLGLGVATEQLTGVFRELKGRAVAWFGDHFRPSTPDTQALSADLPTLANQTPCVPSAHSLCLNDSRFEVAVEWRDPQGQGGAGRAAPLTSDTGSFWFFGPENTELLIKVLDGRGVNGHFWVFYGALSNVEYTLTVTDTETGQRQTYFNPQGSLASVGDTRAFSE